jgi:hypothetical protein
VQVKRILSRNRQIPGKATGTTYFDLRWPSGRISKRDEQFHGLKAAIKFLQHRLRDIPQAERNSLSANLYAEVRKSSGGLGRISLGSCVGEKSLADLFEQAEVIWNELEHEDDNQKTFVPDVIN